MNQIPTCPNCKSTDIVASATTKWSVKKQRFVVLDEEVGTYFCHDCQKDLKHLVMKEIN